MMRVLKKYRRIIESMDIMNRMEEKPVHIEFLNLDRRRGIELIRDQLENCSCTWCLETLNHLMLPRWPLNMAISVMQKNGIIHGMGLEDPSLEGPIALCGASCLEKVEVRWSPIVEVMVKTYRGEKVDLILEDVARRAKLDIKPAFQDY